MALWHLLFVILTHGRGALTQIFPLDRVVDLAFALRWTFAAGVLALSYVAAVKFGGDDALNSLSKSFISEYFGK